MMKYKYNTGGGLSSLPKRTTLRGQDHMLSYITPEEARMLRQQGGGVTPTGGQYRGPGGVPAFFVGPGAPSAAAAAAAAAASGSSTGGHGGPNFGGAGLGSNPGAVGIAGIHGGHGQGNVGSTGVGGGGPLGNMNPYDVQTNIAFDKAVKAAKAKAQNEAADRQLMQIALDESNKFNPALTNPDLYAPVPRNEENQQTIDRQIALAKAKKDGYVPGLQSLHNLANTMDREGDGGFFGHPQGYIDSKTGKVYSSKQDILGLGPKGLAKADMNVQGDPNSPFASVLSGIVGLTPIGLAATVMGTVGEAFSGQPNPFGIQGSIRSFDKGLQSVTGLSLSGDTTSNSSPVSGNKSSSLGLGPKGPYGHTPTGIGHGPNIPQQSSPTSPIVQQGLAATSLPPSTPVVGEEETISQIPTSLSGIKNKYIGAHGGGGIQDLINRQNTDYGVGNQDSIMSGGDAFKRKGFSPNQELMDGSYSNNIMQGHAVPLGMHSAQQPDKPFDPFPSGGQMNTDNTQYADFSKAQSFYSMPNMNRVT